MLTAEQTIAYAEQQLAYCQERVIFYSTKSKAKNRDTLLADFREQENAWASVLAQLQQEETPWTFASQL